MSYKINPEDVPIDFIANHLKGRLFAESVYEADILVIINAAIEAGLVSPPCWAVTRPGSQITWGPLSLEQAKRMVLHDEVIEHWKGQTE